MAELIRIALNLYDFFLCRIQVKRAKFNQSQTF